MTDEAHKREAIRRWRLVLGRFAERRLSACAGGACLNRADRRRDGSLDFLYAREYDARGLGRQAKKGAGSGGSVVKTVDWLNETQRLFPHTVMETIRGHAVERYGLVDALSEAAVEEVEPDVALLGAMMSLARRGDKKVHAALRRIAQRVVDDLMKRLRPEVERTLRGQRNRYRRSQMRAAANFDFARTIRQNLSGWDRERQVLVAERLAFMARKRRFLPWTVILCVDQSGSMTSSLIHAAVMAAILASLPGVKVKMVLFDTSVVDVTDRLDDPLDVILSVQMGGGTDIGGAVAYCERLVENADRTVLALVSDFYEGGSPAVLYGAVARLAEARVRLVGLAALNDDGRADYDGDVAAGVASRGMAVAAMTPDQFAAWFAAQLL